MNNFQFRGWVDQVVEIAFTGSENAGQFAMSVTQNESDALMQMFATVLPTVSGAEPLGAMVEGQIENTVYVRIQCPAYSAAAVFQHLHQLAMAAAPRTPED